MASTAPMPTDPAPPASLVDFPTELLSRILADLAPRDLVACRQVCRRWRDVVKAMEARDAAFAFHCGLFDMVAALRACSVWEKYPELYGLELDDTEFPCTCGAETRELVHVQELDPYAFLAERPAPFESVLKAGGVWADANGDAPDEASLPPSVSAGRPPYGRTHYLPWPPARWEVLAAERALALRLTKMASRLARHVDATNLTTRHYQKGFSGLWLPAWIHLPCDAHRPKTEVGLQAMVRDLFNHGSRQQVHAKLCRADEARAMYADVVERWGHLRARATSSLDDVREFMWFVAFVRERYPVVAAHLIDYRGFDRHDVFRAAIRLFTDTVQPDAPSPNIPLAVFRSSHCDGDMQKAREWCAAIQAFNVAKANGRLADIVADVARAAAWDEPAAWMHVELPGAPRWDGVEGIEEGDEFMDDGLAPSFDRFKRVCRCIHQLLPLYAIASVEVQMDPTGWARFRLEARQAAAAWRLLRSLGWTAYIREFLEAEMAAQLSLTLGEAWWSMSDLEMEASLDRQVEETDRVWRYFQAHVHLPVVVSGVQDPMGFWFGGLSPNGNVVGAFTNVVYDDG